MTSLQSPIDYIVAFALFVIIVGSLVSMVRAHRPAWAIMAVTFWMLVFCSIEVYGALTQNTISENLVASIPLPVMIGGTIVFAIILCVHWVDLWRRRRGGLSLPILDSKELRTVAERLAEDKSWQGNMSDGMRSYLLRSGIIYLRKVERQGSDLDVAYQSLVNALQLYNEAAGNLIQITSPTGSQQ